MDTGLKDKVALVCAASKGLGKAAALALAREGCNNLILSNALRAAVVGFSKTLSNELARDRITVNCVAPGYMRTSRVMELAQANASIQSLDVETVLSRNVGVIPAARYGEPKELGDLVAFLASERAAYITGTTVQVDGGFVRSLM